jgi:hypothetical protein
MAWYPAPWQRGLAGATVTLIILPLGLVGDVGVERRENVSGRASRMSVPDHVVVERAPWAIPADRPATRSALSEPDELAEEAALNRPTCGVGE